MKQFRVQSNLYLAIRASACSVSNTVSVVTYVAFVILCLLASGAAHSQAVAASRPSLGNPSFIHRALAGETPEAIAFAYLADAAKKNIREKFYEHNQIALKDANKPVAPQKPFSIPVEWMFLRPVVATILNATGSSQFSHANTKNTYINLGSNAKWIEEGTSIKTGENSFVNIRFPDNSVLMVKPNSEVVLETLKRYAGSDVFKIKLFVNKGRAESEVKPLSSQASDYSVRSRRLTTGVRGTQFSVTDDPDGNASTEVLEGGVQLTDQSDRAMIVPTGFGSFVAQTRASDLIPLIPAPAWKCDPSGLTMSQSLPLAFSQAPASYRMDIVALESGNQQQLLVKTTQLPATIALGKYRINVRGIDANGLQGYGSDGIVKVIETTTPGTMRWTRENESTDWILQEVPGITIRQFVCGPA
jgi:FecR protein